MTARSAAPAERFAAVLAAHGPAMLVGRSECICGAVIHDDGQFRAHVAAALAVVADAGLAKAWSEGYHHGVEDMTGTETLTVVRRNPYRALLSPAPSADRDERDGA